MRMLHTMLRVTDLDRSIGFYCDVIGMKLLRRNDYPEGKFTLAFVGFGDESDTIGGHVVARLGRLPRPGDELTIGRYQLRVDEVENRRIVRLLCKPLEPQGKKPA